MAGRHRPPGSPRRHRDRHVGPELGTDENYRVSLLVYQRHRISLEILANLAALPATGAHILCGGHINKNGAGSTALIYGMIPPHHH